MMLLFQLLCLILDLKLQWNNFKNIETAVGDKYVAEAMLEK